MSDFFRDCIAADQARPLDRLGARVSPGCWSALLFWPAITFLSSKNHQIESFYQNMIKSNHFGAINKSYDTIQHEDELTLAAWLASAASSVV